MIVFSNTTNMKTISISIRIFLVFTILTGVIYPFLVTGIAQAFFPYQANGSLITENKRTIGSELIGQQFDNAAYFSSRPSANGYQPLPSGGSNYGLTNARLKAQFIDRDKHFIQFNHLPENTNVPSEMVFASASGLDPHISPRAAELQIDRIAKIRRFRPDKKQKLKQLVEKLSEKPQLGFLGESRVNVLLLNIELDQL